MNKAIKEPDLKEWKNKYTEELERYKDFTKRLYDLLKELIGEKRIKTSQIEKRTKTINSFVEKIKRKSYQYDNPLKEITDLSGIRTITFYKEDSDKISDLIEEQFLIDLKNSDDKTKIIDIDKFGYQSIHYVVSLSKERATLLEWKIFENLKAEIQIRTVLQHAWASISHKLSYKTPSEIPKESRRKLSRLSALLELADDEFSRLQKMSIKVDNKYKKDFKEENFEEAEINLASLKAYFKMTKEHIRWSRLATEVGIRINESEAINRTMLRMIFKTLKIAKINKISEFHFLLRNFNKSNLKFYQKFYKNYPLGIIAISPPILIFLIILYVKKNLFNIHHLEYIGISRTFGNKLLKSFRNLKK